VYLNEDDRVQFNQISFRLPFRLPLSTVPPIKNTKYCFTLEVANSLSPPQPTELFADIIDQQHRGEIMRTPQALTMVFHCNQHDVTLLLSRKGGRIRVQTGALEAVWSVLDELCERLQKMADSKNKKLTLSLRDELPLNDYLQLIQDRHQKLTEMRSFESNLEKLSNQFRVIQKRLLMRYKNKNPTPLNEMDVLLEETYRNIISDTNALQKVTEHFDALSEKLWATTRLMWLLIKLKYDLDDENMNILTSFLPLGRDEIDEGWEEQVEAAMVYALRTSLSKSKKDTKISQHRIGKIKDIHKVTRHIRIVCDRLDKGQRFTDRPSF